MTYSEKVEQEMLQKNDETIMNIAKKHFEEKDDTLFINTDDMSYFIREISEIMLLS